MKLYSVGRSPFAARVRCVAYFKEVDLAYVPAPDGGIKGPSYIAINPMGRLPTLVLDDGEIIPESEVIVEYLEQRFPTPPALPQDPAARARARLIARIAELYVLGPVFELFPHVNPATRDEALVEAAFVKLASGLSYLEHYLSDGAFAAGDRFSVADAMAAPAWFWVQEIHRMFGRAASFDGLPRTRCYLEFAQGEPLLGRVWLEMAEDLAALRAGAR